MSQSSSAYKYGMFSRKRARYVKVESAASAGHGPMAVDRARRRRKRFNSVAAAGELKYVDTHSISGIIGLTVFITPLNLTILGDGPNQRDGKAIMCKSVHVRGKLFLNGDVEASAHDHLRMLIVYDRQSNNAVPTWASVITSNDVSSGTASTSYDFTNQDNTDRYQILCDKHWGTDLIAANAEGSGSTRTKQELKGLQPEIDVYRKVNLPTRYSSSGATISDVASGAILLMFLGKVANAQAAWSFEGSARVRFSDKTK